MLNFIDAKTFKLMFLAGAKNLESKKEWINELNVFPVPDGDTGTNMTLTLLSAVKEVMKLSESANLTEVGKKIASGTLRGARGNSGVIMSQLCRGFSKAVEGTDIIDIKLLSKAFERAVQTAYKAVMKPKEGTILTVAKAVATKAGEICNSDLTLEEFLVQVNSYAELVLSQTPDMLPVLKEAGVVDSGGQGLVEFLHGAFDAFAGKEINLDFESAGNMPEPGSYVRKVDSSNLETSDIKFGYCTEFIILLDKEFSEADEKEMKAFLSSLGDSIVCVNMDEVVKVHVHTNHPGEVFEKALTYGQLTSMKIDNMREEHNEKLITESEKQKAIEEEKQIQEEKLLIEETIGPRKEYGFVAVCAGDGIAKVFKSLSVDEVIEGGQTMNPCTDDILEAINKINADCIYVLPNNGNIIMAANQARDLCEDKKVIVIPTKTVCQGINAVINYVPAKNIDDNEIGMTKAAAEIKTGEVTYAVRNTKIDGKKIKKGDYMGISDGDMLSVSKDMIQTTIDMVKAMVDEDTEIITIYYGADTDEETANRISEMLEEDCPDADIIVTYGGQPVYYFILSVE